MDLFLAKNVFTDDGGKVRPAVYSNGNLFGFSSSSKNRVRYNSYGLTLNPGIDFGYSENFRKRKNFVNGASEIMHTLFLTNQGLRDVDRRKSEVTNVIDGKKLTYKIGWIRDDVMELFSSGLKNSLFNLAENDYLMHGRRLITRIEGNKFEVESLRYDEKGRIVNIVDLTEILDTNIAELFNVLFRRQSN